MSDVILGKTGIHSPKNGFGALPIQRVSKEYAAMLLRKAYDAGFTFFDTARAYSDSEEKIGYALSDVRDQITIATKTGATDVETFWDHLETSLKNLKTDYIDLYQFHTPSFCPKPGDGKSGTSVLQTTGWMWQKKRYGLGCMKRCSSRFAILQPRRIWRWLSFAGSIRWGLLR